MTAGAPPPAGDGEDAEALEVANDSVGMIAGIAAGAVLLVVAVIAIACYVDRRGQGKRTDSGAQPRLPDAPRAMEEGTASSSTTGGAEDAHVHPDGEKTLPPPEDDDANRPPPRKTRPAPGGDATPQQALAPAGADLNKLESRESREDEVAEQNETVPPGEMSGVKEKAPSQRRRKSKAAAAGEQNAVRV